MGALSRIECFLLEETDVASSALRRYVSSSKEACSASGMGYHDAEVPLENVEWTEEMRWVEINGTRRRIGGTGSGPLLLDRDDPRWPKACACGRRFTEEDEWQHNVHQLYRVPHTGELVDPSEHRTHVPKAPPGSMWFAWWWADIPEWCGPDGRALMVMTPGGAWHVDGPANNGPGWERSGDPPRFTASPSILINGKYHGWLRDGWLEEC